jgi:hypothetical protein
MNESDLVLVSRDILWKWHDAAEWLRHVAQQDGHEYYAELAEELRQDIDDLLLHDGSPRNKPNQEKV